MSEQIPDMIDMMSESGLRAACRELSIDVERKRKRIAELETRITKYEDQINRKIQDLIARQEFDEKLEKWEE